ncbi:Uridylate kinase [Quillaja saponaria]|uniref:UMP kinase n=1 Tax=Quillaja saponaria TaxID=32244 RepID=A0AAD7PYF4_QUISA|nr:Uridylate kinase [Quillaja saponaria]
MASCDDDDFSLLANDHQQSNVNNHHRQQLHQNYASLRFSNTVTAVNTPPRPLPIQTKRVGTGEHVDDTGEGFDDAVFCSNTFEDGADRNEKRKDGEDLSEETTPYCYKKSKPSSSGDYRKDREEWSDEAIECLLEAYMEKFAQLNRGNLRGRDWEEVASVVSERCEKQSKTVEQCKNKVDNLKKRYKLERHRMSIGGISISHWPWFKKMEQIVGIVGNSLPVKVVTDDDKGVCSSGITPRQSKRFVVATPSSGSQIITVKSKAMSNVRWRRVVLKISGAALTGSGTGSIDQKVATLISREVAMACRLGVQVAIVVGGRNFFCGDAWVTTTGLERCTAYQVGMMATVMNSLLIQSALENMGVQTRVQSTLAIQESTEPYNRQRAIRHLEKGRVVIFGGVGFGTANPLFSTDTAAALRASEIHAEAVLKGTNVDGVYDCNAQDNNFTFEHISFGELVSRGATSMDMTALTFCEENGIPVVVFNLLEPGNISKALCGEQVGTLIDQIGSIS